MPLSDPHRATSRLNDVVRRLNSVWDLQLDLSGEATEPTANPLATECLESLQALASGQRGAGLARLIADWEDHAKYLESKWTFKPSQRPGSLASLPRTKSLLSRDVAAKTGKRRLASEHRQLLLESLSDRLRDDVQLSQSSDAYELQPAPHSSGAFEMLPASHIASNTKAQTMGGDSISNAKEPVTKKRGSSVLRNESPNPYKKQARVEDVLESVSDFRHDLSHILMAGRNDQKELQTSFQSRISSDASEIFTPPIGHIASSNATSLLSTDEDDSTSQDYFPTQEAKDFLADPSFQQSFEELEASFNDGSFLHELSSYGPLAQTSRSQLPSNVTFLYRYELQRLASLLRLSEQNLWGRLKEELQTASPDYGKFWQSVQAIARSEKVEVPPRPSARAVTAAHSNFEDKCSGWTVTLSGHLDWTNSDEKGLFQLQLLPPKLDTSCRLHRRFGADRFLVLSMPFFTTNRIPKEIHRKQKLRDTAFADMVKWLSSVSHSVAGRTWRVFFMEPEKGRKKKQDGQSEQRVKIHLFATDGIDFGLATSKNSLSSTNNPRGSRHTPLGISQLIQWHLRPAHQTSTDLKLFSRFSLALSKTTSTVILEGPEFIVLADPPSGTPVMNDGCAMMSLQLAKKVAEMLDIEKGRLPTAFQARIGGAKGLWVVDYHDSHPWPSKRGFWIEISSSQLKILPHPNKLPTADPEQRTFEVLKYSSPARPGYLNGQYLNILDYHKIPRQVVNNCVLQDIREYTQSLGESIDDPLKLASWTAQYHRPFRSEHDIVFLGGFPRKAEEQVMMLLECGFETKECSILVERLKAFVNRVLDDYVERLRIKVNQSTTVFCVADPYGVLGEGEVFLGLSEKWENPLTGVSENGIFGVDLLVGRNPAHLASDIQRVRAVFHEKLRNYQDVIVFSTQGNTPLASLLSGGDYDGDVVWACWDQAFVHHFQNSAPPHDPPSADDCGLEVISKPICDVFSRSENATNGGPDEPFENFLMSSISFNANPSLLGACVLEHERVVYHEKASLAASKCIKLATLAGYLVNANKQGYYLSDSAWFNLRREISGPVALANPAYRTGQPPRPGPVGKLTNVIDWLRFDVAETEKENVLRTITQRWSGNIDYSKYNSRLSKLWKDVVEKATRTKRSPEGAALQIILAHLKKNIADLYGVWGQQAAAGEADTTHFVRVVDTLYQRLQEIKPPHGVTHSLVDRFGEEEGQEYSYWALLRASCFYYHYRRGTAVWYLCGKELCKIMADSTKQPRTMTAKMHRIFKVDRKMIDKFTSSRVGDEGSDDDFSIEDDGAALMESWIL